MKTFALGFHIYPLPKNPTTISSFLLPKIPPKNLTATSPKTLATTKPSLSAETPRAKSDHKTDRSSKGYSKFLILGAISVGIGLVLAEQKAAALGPEGPLAEEFWDNVRRYALYALTVSTGAIYTIMQPIVELLKNPISAILILVILAGTIYVVSQVLSAMVGVTDFTYDYGY